MKLLYEIIDLAVDNSSSVSVLLRKCLVLAHTLKNERLKTWVEKELNGYDNEDELPEYRRVVAVAKGLLLGPFGAMINDQPLAGFVLKPEHRHFATEVRLVQPIAAYEGEFEKASTLVLEWPPNLTAMYHRKFSKATYLIERGRRSAVCFCRASRYGQEPNLGICPRNQRRAWNGK